MIERGKSQTALVISALSALKVQLQYVYAYILYINVKKTAVYTQVNGK